jgi:hypothetical protein
VAPQVVRRVHLSAEAAPFAADIDDGGDAFMVAGGRGPVAVWTETVAAGVDAPTAVVPLAEALTAARFARVDGNVAVFTATEARGSVGLWSWQGGEKKATATYQHTFGVRNSHAALSMDGRFVALAGAVFDRRTAEQVGERVHLTTQSSLAIAEDGRRVVLAGFHEPWVVVRDLPGGAVRRWQSPDKVAAVAIDARGELIAVATRDGRIRLWRQPSGEPAGSFAAGASRGGTTGDGLQFVAADRHLAFADEAGVFLCDVQSGRRLWRADVEGGLVSFAVRGNLAAAGTGGGVVIVWDLSRRSVLARVQASPTSVTAVAVSERRRLVLAADQNGDATLWHW